jgi:hypothetical protein
VGVAPSIAIPPPGRHLVIVPAGDLDAVAAMLAPLARHVVAVGSDDLDVARVAPPHARRSLLGAMQRPPFDGPVDLRPEWR